MLLEGDETIGFGDVFFKIGCFEMSRFDFIVGDFASCWSGCAMLMLNSCDSSVLIRSCSDFYRDLFDLGVVALNMDGGSSLNFWKSKFVEY